MHPHGVEVLHVADGDAVVCAVAHHLVLDLFPADQRPFDQHLPNRAGVQTPLDDGGEVVPPLCHAAAGAAEGVSRPDDERKADLLGKSLGLAHRGDDHAFRHRLADLLHQPAKQIAVFGASDGIQWGTEQAHPIPIQHAGCGEVHGEVEAGLPTERGQQTVGALLGNDALDDRHRQRLDIHGVGDVLVGHDRGRVRVDQHRRNALFAHGLAGLRAGVVELGSLPDHYRTGAENEHLLRAVAVVSHGCPVFG